MFLTFPFIDQAISLKLRFLSIRSTSERLSLADCRGSNHPLRIPPVPSTFYLA